MSQTIRELIQTYDSVHIDYLRTIWSLNYTISENKSEQSNQIQPSLMTQAVLKTQCGSFCHVPAFIFPSLSRKTLPSQAATRQIRQP